MFEIADFRSAYEQHFNDVYRFLYWSLGNKETSEEVAQQVFEDYWKLLLKAETPHSPKAWLLAAAHNQFKAHIRNRSRRQKILTENSMHFPGEDHNDPAKIFERKELTKLLHTAIASLTEAQTNIIKGLCLQSKKYDQMVVETGLSERSLRYAKQKSLQHLGKALATVV